MSLDVSSCFLLFAAPEPDGPCLIATFTVPFFLSLVSSPPPAGCGGPALLRSAHHVIIHTAVGTPPCWRPTRCHRVLPSQVSYGLIGGVGVVINYSKLFVCICKHTASRIRIWRGCPVEVGYHTYFLALGFALQPISCSLQVTATSPTPTPGPLMDLPSVKTGQQM